LANVPEDRLHPYLRHGDRVRMEVLDTAGCSVFGAIDQVVQIQ
jgi:fumarylacetoacetate (FAA) hydrolase